MLMPRSSILSRRPETVAITLEKQSRRQASGRGTVERAPARSREVSFTRPCWGSHVPAVAMFMPEGISKGGNPGRLTGCGRHRGECNNECKRVENLS
jgi:hypothetical protein